jgi:hypothetical protein
MEYDILKCTPIVSSKSHTSLIDDDDDECMPFRMPAFLTSCREVLEIGLDETMLGSSYELKTFDRKYKFVISKDECMTGQKRLRWQNLLLFPKNGIFKKCRDLRELAKHLHIAECTREYLLDFFYYF